MTRLPDGSGVGRGPIIKIPDARVELLSKHFDVTGKKVLEPGCLEGWNTISLLNAGAVVTSYDTQEANVALTKLRCEWHGYKDVDCCQYNSIEHFVYDEELLQTEFDLVFHTGLLYHLADPASEIRYMSWLAPVLFIQTHFVSTGNHRLYDQDAIYFGEFKEESSGQDLIGGMDSKSFWLTIPSLLRLLTINGKGDITILSVDEQSHSICLLARSFS